MLGLELTLDAITISFADDLALIVGAGNVSIVYEFVRIIHANKCLEEISAWMKGIQVNEIARKKQSVIIKRGRKDKLRLEHIRFMLNGVRILLKKTVRYSRQNRKKNR